MLAVWWTMVDTLRPPCVEHILEPWYFYSFAKGRFLGTLYYCISCGQPAHGLTDLPRLS